MTYSDVENKHKISSVSDYLKLINESKLSNYIYRGQNEPYFGIKASGFRPYMGGWDSDKFYDINSLANDFYKRIISRLSKDEKKHFLAFAQHHGLPTNLVDFTYSPLIALFFACQGKSKPSFTLEELINIDSYSDLDKIRKDENLKDTLINNMIVKLSKSYYSPCAQIYLINKERLIDISNIIIDYRNENFFELLEKDTDIQMFLRDEVEMKFKNEKELLFYSIENLLDSYIDNNVDFHEVIHTYSGESYNESIAKLKQFKEDLADLKNREIIQKLYLYLSNEIDIARSKMYYIETSLVECKDEESVAARIYVALLINLIQIANDCSETLNIKLDFYFTYQPPNLFERITNQKGLFVYQPYIYSIDSVYNHGVLTNQLIKPDIIIEVDNHKSVLTELNHLGINLETVYSDFDNIARDVVFEHDERLKK